MRKEEISNIISFLLIISFCFILFLSVFKQDNSRAHLPNPTTSTTTSMNTYTVKLLIFNKVNNVINESNIIYATWFCLGIWRCLVCGFVWMKERRKILTPNGVLSWGYLQNVQNQFLRTFTDIVCWNFTLIYSFHFSFSFTITFYNLSRF